MRERWKTDVSMNVLDPVDLPNLNEIVYDRLRQAILRYDFTPGQRLDLMEMENHLQVSRTPLKNALIRLEVEGLIEIHARRGTFVAGITAEKLEEDYKIRSAFELYVALCLHKYLTPYDYDFFRNMRFEMNALASQAQVDGWQGVIQPYLELDRALHEHLVACGGTPNMIKLWQQANVHTQIMRLTHQHEDLDFASFHLDHLQIIDAIESGSPDRLNAALLNHLEQARLTVLRALS